MIQFEFLLVKAPFHLENVSSNVPFHILRNQVGLVLGNPQ